MSTAPQNDGPDGRSLSGLGAIVFVAILATVAGGVWYAQRWIEGRSDEWALAAADARLDAAHLAEAEREGLRAEVARLAAAFDQGDIAYDALFACAQRLIEGTLVPAAEAQHFARELEANGDAAASLAFQRLARTIRIAPALPVRAQELLTDLRAPAPGEESAEGSETTPPPTPAESGPVAAEIADLYETPPEGWTFDAVADYRALVDRTLAGTPPERLPQR